MKNYILLLTFACVLSSCATGKRAIKTPETSFEFCGNYQLIIVANQPSIIKRISVDEPDKLITIVHGKSVAIVQPNHGIDESEKKDRPAKVRVFLISDEKKKDRSIANFIESDCKTSKTYFIGQ